MAIVGRQEDEQPLHVVAGAHVLLNEEEAVSGFGSVESSLALPNGGVESKVRFGSWRGATLAAFRASEMRLALLRVKKQPETPGRLDETGKVSGLTPTYEALENMLKLTDGHWLRHYDSSYCTRSAALEVFAVVVK